jgi:hypothetical protein
LWLQVEEEQISAEEAMRILEDSKRMYQEEMAKKASEGI